MKILNLTPEQYKKFALTATWEQLRQVNIQVMAIAKGCIKRIKRLLTRNRSCLAAKPVVRIKSTVYPFSYNKNNPMAGFNDAALGWSFQEQVKLRDFIDQDDEPTIYADRCSRMRELVEDEIKMEELFATSIQLVIK